MKFRSHSALLTTEKLEELRFHVVREVGLLEWSFPFLASAVILLSLRLAFGWRAVNNADVAALLAGSFLAEALILRKKSRVYDLVISKDQLTASEDYGRSHSTILTLAAEDVDSLRWVPGGLHLQVLGKPSQCVLPGLKRGQINALVEAVHNKFPDSWEKYCPAGSHPFGYAVGLTPMDYYKRLEDMKNVDSAALP